MTKRADAFTACWTRDSGRVAAYVTRHVGCDEAADVVAETFLIAWRRWSEVPEPALPWLIGTARLVIANQRRSVRRRTELQERLRRLEGIARTADDVSLSASRRAEALEQLARLNENHREALLLTAWDGLSTDEAAAVLGIRAGTLRARISRARQALLDRAAAGEGTSLHTATTVQEIS